MQQDEAEMHREEKRNKNNMKKYERNINAVENSMHRYMNLCEIYGKVELLWYICMQQRINKIKEMSNKKS